MTNAFQADKGRPPLDVSVSQVQKGALSSDFCAAQPRLSSQAAACPELTSEVASVKTITVPLFDMSRVGPEGLKDDVSKLG